jgi:preprotein translocase subunit SecD/preprotein translocase subunit SecF
MLFGIVVGTSSSIFIAAPILLFLGEHRMRRDAAAPVTAAIKPDTPPPASGAAPSAKAASARPGAGKGGPGVPGPAKAAPAPRR